MTPPRTSPFRRKLLLLAAAVAVLGCATLVYCVDPAKGGVYPPCLFHAMTGCIVPAADRSARCTGSCTANSPPPFA